MFDCVEIDGSARGVIAEMDSRATDRTIGVSPIVELSLVYRFDLLIKVFGEIDQERRYGASASKGYACAGYSITLDANRLTILTCRPSVMTANQFLPIRDSLHPIDRSLLPDVAWEVANRDFRQDSMTGKVAAQ